MHFFHAFSKALLHACSNLLIASSIILDAMSSSLNDRSGFRRRDMERRECRSIDGTDATISSSFGASYDCISACNLFAFFFFLSRKGGSLTVFSFSSHLVLGANRPKLFTRQQIS